MCQTNAMVTFFFFLPTFAQKPLRFSKWNQWIHKLDSEREQREPRTLVVYSFYVQITQKQCELYADFTAFLKNKSYLGVQSVEVCLT